ncbi:hypothetical protein QW180_28355 [Vibrio sinaloensis]|nr:hypothetical protein [Vibrio sinaloensis]
MSFALYGETTGDERQGTQMRSDLAKINVATEVTFEFALQEKNLPRDTLTRARSAKSAR